jgi:hypothetical protein
LDTIKLIAFVQELQHVSNPFHGYDLWTYKRYFKIQNFDRKFSCTVTLQHKEHAVGIGAA